jgi:homoserine dehydrogenase
MIRNEHPLSAVNDSFNAVFVQGDHLGDSMFYGRGAGELPTASAIVGDVIDLAMHQPTGGTSPAMNFDLSEKKIIPMGNIISKYFLRLKVKDQPGVLAAISKIFADQEVSIKAVQQKEAIGVEAELVIITHSVKESSMQRAVKDIQKLSTVLSVCSLIRADL